MNHDQLVADLIAQRTLATGAIIEAFRAIDRGGFVPPDLRAMAYDDRPLPLAIGATISQPTTVAIMLELLQPQVGDRVLDVGSGSGWTTALLAACVGATGTVTGTEVIPGLVEMGRSNLAACGIHSAAIVQAAGELGQPGQMFDRILVSAAAPQLPPALIAQMTVGGTMVIPVGHSLYKVMRVSDDTIDTTERPGFVFVPLR